MYLNISEPEFYVKLRQRSFFLQIFVCSNIIFYYYVYLVGNYCDIPVLKILSINYKKGSLDTEECENEGV